MCILETILGERRKDLISHLSVFVQRQLQGWEMPGEMGTTQVAEKGTRVFASFLGMGHPREPDPTISFHKLGF